MSLVQENWLWIVLFLLVVITLYLFITGKASAKRWLLYAVSLAEKELGSGTGKLKIRVVYDAFIVNYPVLSKIIPFTVFSMWVDYALKELRHLLETNQNINVYIKGE